MLLLSWVEPEARNGFVDLPRLGEDSWNMFMISSMFEFSSFWDGIRGFGDLECLESCFGESLLRNMEPPKVLMNMEGISCL